MIPLLLLFTAQATGAVTPPLLPDYAHAERVDRAEARATAFHRRMDMDGDGYVTQAEIARYAAGLAKGATIPGTDAAPPLPAPSLAFFRVADADHDGRISLAEAVAAARRDFDRQDGDHDGVVTPAERIAFMTKIVKDGRTPAGVPILPPGPRAGAMPAAPSSTPRPATCAAADIVGIAPADLLQSLDDFRASLSAPDRARLDRALPRAADGGVGSCEAVTGSRASCEAAAYLPALRRTGLMPRFLTTICAGPAAIGTGGPTDHPAPAPASVPHRPSTSRPS